MSPDQRIPSPSLLAELSADPSRQAVATIRGYIYQFWWSVDAWLQLQNADDMIYLEGAEDLDRVTADGATTEQIKHEAASISLNNRRAHKALENFWTVSEKEVSRRIAFHYISTAPAASEQDGVFGDVSGVDAWRIAQTSIAMASVIRDYLAQKLAPESKLRAFLISASPEEVQFRLLRRFQWFLGQPGVKEVLQSVEDRLTVRLSQKHIHLSYTSRVMDRLYAYVSGAIIRPESIKRRLNLADLLREIDTATTDHIAVPAAQHHQFVAAMQSGAFDPGEALLRHMRLPLPAVPSPLLPRPQTVAEVRSLMEQRKTVMLTGSVFKGKTTTAQLVANELCPEAWWFPVSQRSGSETDSLLRALAAVIDNEATPSLVVIDDIDLSPMSQAAYRHSLSLAVSRANRSGRGLILTARGASNGAARLSGFIGVETVEVPEMSTEEIQLHCDANGCKNTSSAAWSSLIRATTGGHPKLVQVRIVELSASDWPILRSAEQITNSRAIGTARQFARQLLSESVSPTTAEFLYTAAEATYPLTRPMLLRLIEIVGGVVNGGDLIESLLGKWLEVVPVERIRVTSILKGSATEVWLPERQKSAHRRLYDAIAGDRTLDASDAAALLFHAFVSDDSSRLMHCVTLLESVGSLLVSSAIYQQLLWVPYVALLPEQRFFEADPYVSALMRQLQFAVANDIDSDSLPAILERWIEEVNMIPDAAPRDGMRVMMWSRVVINRNPRISLRKKLCAIDALRHLEGEMADVANAGALRTIEMSRDSLGGIPEGANVSQFLLSLQASTVRSVDELSSFLDWLEYDALAETRVDFEKVLHWPLINSAGAYVHGAWAAQHAEKKDWDSTIATLRRAIGLARRFGLAQYGSEVAKAMSIVYGEQMDDHSSAMRVLEEATAQFGDTVTLREQRVNALFQIKDDAQALEVWGQLFIDPALSRTLDSFAFRRAGISAARLGRWPEAEKFFLAGAVSQPEFCPEITKFGLTADASYVAALSNDRQRAARMLADMLLKLPPVAWEDGSESWEAFLRVVVSIRESIASVAFGAEEVERKVPFGKASEPGLSFGPALPGQNLRTELVIARVGLLAAQLGCVPEEYSARLASQRASEFPLLRFHSSIGVLALEFHLGTSFDFVDSLAAFERAFNLLQAFQDRPDGTRKDGGDSEPEPTKFKTVEQGWFAVFSAAAICCDYPKQSLKLWRDAAAARWGPKSEVVKDLGDISRGLWMSSKEAWNVVHRRVKASRGEMFGAAFGLLKASDLPPRTIFWLECVVLSATVCHSQGLLLQATFGRPVARRLAMVWEPLLSSPLLFKSPLATIPSLAHTISQVKNGQESIKALMTSVARTVGASLGDVGNRLE